MEHRRIIKQGAVVVATQEDGSIEPTGIFTQGLFVGDTRFLSRFRIYLDGLAPSLMGSGEEKLYQAGYLHTNPVLPHAPARSFGLVQRTAIEDGTVTITLAVRNMTLDPIEFELSLDIDADFFDSFETRGVKRDKRGETFAVETTMMTLRMPEQGYYAMALDGHHRQVDTITSNPGHCLWTGLIDAERAGEMAQVLMSRPMANSWGIRTMAETEKRHNPISYHNGSVWPFENALIIDSA